MVSLGFECEHQAHLSKITKPDLVATASSEPFRLGAGLSPKLVWGDQAIAKEICQLA